MKKPILKNDLEVKIDGTQKITNNINEVKKFALAMKDYYSKLAFTEEQVDEAKAERASVNKIVKKVEDYRKDIVKQFNKPLEEFVNSTKETEKLLKDASEFIDIQVKNYESKVKEQKKEECEELFNSIIGELKELITFEKVFNEKWLNKGTKMIQVEEDIKALMTKVNAGVEAIRELNSEFETELINTFLQDYDLSKAIMKNTQLKAQKEALNKTEALQEEVKEEKIEKMVSKPIETITDEPIKSYILKITADYNKMVQLKKFMDINKIKYEKVQ